MTTMRTTAIATVMSLCLPALAAAQDAAEVTEAELDTTRAAITDAGCVVADAETAAGVETATGYGAERLAEIVGQLRVYDEIVDASEDGGIRLVSGGCAE